MMSKCRSLSYDKISLTRRKRIVMKSTGTLGWLVDFNILVDMASLLQCHSANDRDIAAVYGHDMLFVRGRLKMREWKMRHGQKMQGWKIQEWKCRSSLAEWKGEPRLYRDTALSYFMENVLRHLTE